MILGSVVQTKRQQMSHANKYGLFCRDSRSQSGHHRQLYEIKKCPDLASAKLRKLSANYVLQAQKVVQTYA